MSLLAQDERLTRRVGTATLLVLAAAIAFMLLIYDRIEWGRHVRVHVYFHYTGSLREGAPFVVGGQTVGDCEAIVLVPHGGKTPLDGEAGVAVTVAIEARYAERITDGGEVFVAARGPLGERYLEYAPPAVPGAPIAEGHEFKGRDPATLDRVFQRTWDNLTIAKQFADELRPEFTQLRDQLRALAAALDGLAPDAADVLATGWDIAGVIAEGKKLRAALAQADTTSLLKDARVTLARLRATLDTLAPKARALGASAGELAARFGPRRDTIAAQIDVTIDRIRAAIAKVEPLLATLDEINDRIARGEGSLLKLSRDPEFPEDAKELGKILKRQPWKIIDRPQD